MRLIFDCELKVYVSVYEYINSNMFIFVSNEEAVVVDPHVSEDVHDLFREHGVKKITIILTHEHCDHISGIWWFLERFDCKIICSSACASQIADKKHTRPLMLAFKIEEDDFKNGTNKIEKFNKTYVWTSYKADVTYQDQMAYEWQGHKFYFYAAPGHSVGSSFIIIDDEYVLTGDSLLKEYPIILTFPKSDKNIFVKETLPFFEKKLNPKMTILPGHGEPFLLQDIMKDGRINVELR